MTIGETFPSFVTKLSHSGPVSSEWAQAKGLTEMSHKSLRTPPDALGHREVRSPPPHTAPHTCARKEQTSGAACMMPATAEDQILAQISKLKRQLDSERKKKTPNLAEAAEVHDPMASRCTQPDCPQLTDPWWSQADEDRQTRLIVVANRLPLTELQRDPVTSQWHSQASSGGLVSAFMGVKGIPMT